MQQYPRLLDFVNDPTPATVPPAFPPGTMLLYLPSPPPTSELVTNREDSLPESDLRKVRASILYSCLKRNAVCARVPLRHWCSCINPLSSGAWVLYQPPAVLQSRSVNGVAKRWSALAGHGSGP